MRVSVSAFSLALAALICAQHGAQLIETIGSIIVLYRRNRETNRFATVLGE